MIFQRLNATSVKNLDIFHPNAYLRFKKFNQKMTLKIKFALLELGMMKNLLIQITFHLLQKENKRKDVPVIMHMNGFQINILFEDHQVLLDIINKISDEVIKKNVIEKFIKKKENSL